MKGDWLDPAFMELIDYAIAENDSEGKFYYCGELTGYLFLTTSQHKFLKETQAELFQEY